jgi:hypothetical protein
MNIFIEYKRDDMLCLDNWGCVQLVNVNVLQAWHGEARETLQNLCIFFVEPTIQKLG